ncbi:MAG: hypothetical protein AAGI38_18145 [Bacteroidota bacterium]
MNHQKVIFLIGMLWGTLISGNAQEPYQRMIYDDAHWIVGVRDTQWIGPVFHTQWHGIYEYFISGDSILNGKTYKKVYAHSLNFKNGLHRLWRPPFYIAGPDYFEALVREDTVARKVYGVFHKTYQNRASFSLSYCTPHQEEVLYDFSLQVGDTTQWCGPYGGIHDSLLSISWQPHDTVIPMGGGYGMYGHDTLKVYKTKHNTFYEGIGFEGGFLEAKERYDVFDHKLRYYCREKDGGCPRTLLLISNDDRLAPGQWSLYYDELASTLNLDLKRTPLTQYPDTWQLTDLSGRMVRQEAVQVRQAAYTLPELSAGVYLFTLKRKGRVVGYRKLGVR